MRTRLSGILAMAGIALIAFPSCVSSKKYKTSQATLQRVRDDSARLAQQVATLNGNLQSEQDKNASLQKSLDNKTAEYTAQQSKLDNYQGYFSKQQEAMGRVSQEIKDNKDAGLTDADLEQSNGMLYVNLDENKVFRKNSTMVSKEGKQMISGLATVLKSHDDINVGVDNGYTATGAMAGSDMNSSGSMSSSSSSSSDWSNASAPKKHHYVKHRAASTSTASSGTASSGNAASTGTNATASTGTKAATPRRHVARNYSKESTAAWTSKGMSSKERSAWMLKAARVNSMAGSLLKEGLPRVAIIAQRPPTDGSANNGKIRVIVTHTPGEMPQTSGSVSSSANGTVGMDK